VVGLIVHARSYRVARRDELFQTFIASVPTRKGKHQ
jgi:archaellum biogenesis protein FlaJ (TadC family)